MQRAHSFLWQFHMGGGHHLSFSHQLTVSEWALIDSIDMQRACSFLWQFCGGRTSAKVCLSAKFELIVSSFALPSQSSFVSYKK